MAQLTLSSYATTIGETATAVRRTTAIPTTCRKKRVVQNSAFNFSAFLRQERTGGAVSIAVESTNTSVVYVSWCDNQNGVYTTHLRQSSDRGVTWSPDLIVVASATNPALAVNNQGIIGFLYFERSVAVSMHLV